MRSFLSVLGYWLAWPFAAYWLVMGTESAVVMLLGLAVLASAFFVVGHPHSLGALSLLIFGGLIVGLQFPALEFLVMGGYVWIWPWFVALIGGFTSPFVEAAEERREFYSRANRVTREMEEQGRY